MVIFGLLFGLLIRQGKLAPKPALAAVAAAPTAAAGDLAFIDVPLAGEQIGTLYFAVGDSALPADAAPNKKLVLSGFRDATGDPAKNAELAKNRAKAVRNALQGDGLAPERIALRNPESTTGDGTNQEARRVEVRLTD